MVVNSEAVGKTWVSRYAVGREKIREYSTSVGETNPLHFDVDAARAAGYADLLAPPMFVGVYGTRAVVPVLLDPIVAMDFAMMVHVGQEFVWGEAVVAGDEITTQVSCRDISERGPMGFYVFDTNSENQRGDVVCSGTWTHAVRMS